VIDVHALVDEVRAEAPGVAPRAVLEAARPTVIRDLVAHWPSVESAVAGNGALLSYLRKLHRDRPILAFQGSAEMRGRFFYNDDLSGFNFDTVNTTVGRFLDRMAAKDVDNHAYIGSSTVQHYFPGFEQQNMLDIGIENPLISIWMGNQSRVAAHFDAPSNVACVVAGRRRFTLFPPEQLPNLYVGPIDLTPAGQAISLVDFADPDLSRFPRFAEAMAAAQVAELGPGDALYLPSMWWHHVEALADVNVLVNYWWSRPGLASGNPMNALIHALLSIRGLTPEKRRAWQGLFEHYVFTASEDAHAHIPEDRRGVLGTLDRQTQKQLRDMLRNALQG